MTSWQRPCCHLLNYAFGHAQQPGTNMESGLRGCLMIYLQLDPIIFQDKIDHAAFFDKTSRFAYGQNAGVPQSIDNLAGLPVLRRVDKQYLAGAGLDRKSV